MPSDKLAKLCQEVGKGEARNTILCVDVDREKVSLESTCKNLALQFTNAAPGQK